MGRARETETRSDAARKKSDRVLGARHLVLGMAVLVMVAGLWMGTRSDRGDRIASQSESREPGGPPVGGRGALKRLGGSALAERNPSGGAMTEAEAAEAGYVSSEDLGIGPAEPPDVDLPPPSNTAPDPARDVLSKHGTVEGDRGPRADVVAIESDQLGAN
jgi:hypothetical protein